MSLNKKMGDKHERDVCDRLDGARLSRGSGNQWRNPMDARQNRYEDPLAVAVDCKSTLGKSVGVSREMWAKAKEQAHGERPALPLRFYNNERLDVDLDLIVISLDDYEELREYAQRGYQAKS